MDASQRMKKLTAPDQVTDEQGRRRFHGAFTGGFSAGHFNTVGSAEGWAPQSFVSSRSNRSKKKAQSTLDFMDDEDGLLGGQLQTKEAYDTFSTATLSRLERVAELAAATGGGSVIPGPMPGELLSVSSSARPVGYKLLQQLGWREGHAIGRRHTRRLTKQEAAATGGSGGLVLPAGVDISQLPSQAFGGDGGGSTAGGSNDVTSAPRSADCTSQQAQKPKPKLDTFGLGYDPSASVRGGGGGVGDVLALRASRSRHRHDGSGGGAGAYHTDSLFGGASGAQSRRSGAKDQGGFALFDDEDDVYDDSEEPVSSSVSSTERGQPRASQFHALDDSQHLFRVENKATASAGLGGSYSSDSGGGGERQRQLYLQDVGQASASFEEPQMELSLPAQRCSTDNRPPLAGFRVRQTVTLLGAQTRFPLPVVPPGFRELHVFPTPAKKQSDISAAETTTTVPPFSSSSGAVGSGAVYAMLDAKGKEQYNEALRQKASAEGDAVEGFAGAGSKRALLSHLQGEESSRQRRLQQTAFSQGLGDALRNRFTSAASTGDRAGTAGEGGGSVSQKQALAAAYGLSSSFQSASTISPDTADSSRRSGVRELPCRGTRSTSSWQPSRLLCKRMNVPVPTPSASANLPFASSMDASQLGGDSTRLKREKELYEANIGRFLPGTSSKAGTGTGSSKSTSGERMVPVVSSVTGDFELVAEASLRVQEVPPPPLPVETAPPPPLLPPEESKEEAETAMRNAAASSTTAVEASSSLSAAAVIPSLSLFQSIFCSKSDSDSDSDSGDDSDDDDGDKGKVEKNRSNAGGGERMEDEQPESSSRAVEIKDSEENKGSIDARGEPVKEGGGSGGLKVVFRKPEKNDKGKGKPGQSMVGGSSRGAAGERKRKRRMAVLSFQEEVSEEEQEEKMNEDKSNSSAPAALVEAEVSLETCPSRHLCPPEYHHEAPQRREDLSHDPFSEVAGKSEGHKRRRHDGGIDDSSDDVSGSDRDDSDSDRDEKNEKYSRRKEKKRHKEKKSHKHKKKSGDSSRREHHKSKKSKREV